MPRGLWVTESGESAKATICMPQITPPLKVDATKAYGADVVLYGDVFDGTASNGPA